MVQSPPRQLSTDMKEVIKMVITAVNNLIFSCMAVISHSQKKEIDFSKQCIVIIITIIWSGTHYCRYSIFVLYSVHLTSFPYLTIGAGY